MTIDCITTVTYPYALLTIRLPLSGSALLRNPKEAVTTERVATLLTLSRLWGQETFWGLPIFPGPWHTGYKSFLLSAELFIGTVLACAVKYMLVLWV